MNANGLVAPVLRRIAIGGQEPPFGLPSGPASPPRSVRRRRGQGDGGAWPACGHLDTQILERNSTGPQPWPTRLPDAAADVAWRIAPPGLRNHLLGPALPPTGNCKPRADGVQRRDAAQSVVDQVGQSPVPLLVGCAGYGPCPAARRLARRCAACAASAVVAPSSRHARQDRGRQDDRDARPPPEARPSSAVVSRSRVRTPAPAGKRTRRGRQSNACSGVTRMERQDVESVPNSARLLHIWNRPLSHYDASRIALAPSRERRRRRNEVSK
jgi:hypothetical protein